MADLAFASTLAGLADPVDVLALEKRTGRAGRFDTIDTLTADLLAAALDGTAIASIARNRLGSKNSDLMAIGPMDSGQRLEVDNAFTLAAQQARGTWFLPEQTSLKLGLVNLAAYLRHYPAHAFTIAADDVAVLRFPQVLMYCLPGRCSSHNLTPSPLRSPLAPPASPATRISSGQRGLRLR